MELSSRRACACACSCACTLAQTGRPCRDGAGGPALRRQVRSPRKRCAQPCSASLSHALPLLHPLFSPRCCARLLSDNGPNRLSVKRGQLRSKSADLSAVHSAVGRHLCFREMDLETSRLNDGERRRQQSSAAT
eukprot:6199883-Pleurochrysis_carterae.AAC.1